MLVDTSSGEKDELALYELYDVIYHKTPHCFVSYIQICLIWTCL
jgi:hypothetical protein